MNAEQIAIGVVALLGLVAACLGAVVWMQSRTACRWLKKAADSLIHVPVECGLCLSEGAATGAQPRTHTAAALLARAEGYLARARLLAHLPPLCWFKLEAGVTCGLRDFNLRADLTSRDRTIPPRLIGVARAIVQIRTAALQGTADDAKATRERIMAALDAFRKDFDSTTNPGTMGTAPDAPTEKGD